MRSCENVLIHAQLDNGKISEAEVKRKPNKHLHSEFKERGIEAVGELVRD
jgi:hypothetical protein